MNIIGIDYGLSKVGVAIANSKLAEPYLVIRRLDIGELVKKIKRICEENNIEMIVVGISEGEMAEQTKKFVEKLKLETEIPVIMFDETLSTFDAQRLSREAGMGRNKRKNMEDAMAACVMLQSYLDSQLWCYNMLR